LAPGGKQAAPAIDGIGAKQRPKAVGTRYGSRNKLGEGEEVAEHGNYTEPQRIGPRVPPRRLTDPPLTDTEYAAASRRRTARMVGAGVLALAVGLVIVAIVGRDAILAIWPSTAGVYRAFNLVATPGAGLKISLSVTRTGGGLTVAGDIVNGASKTRDLPRLRVSLQDARRNDLEVKTIDPPVARLAPGATARFETVFDHPSMAATGAAAVFATDR
jgi:hypothetical protein